LKENAIRQLFAEKDLLAFLPTGHGKIKSYFSVSFVAQEELENYASLLVITSNVSIINDQMFGRHRSLML